MSDANHNQPNQNPSQSEYVQSVFTTLQMEPIDPALTAGQPSTPLRLAAQPSPPQSFPSNMGQFQNLNSHPTLPSSNSPHYFDMAAQNNPNLSVMGNGMGNGMEPAQGPIFNQQSPAFGFQNSPQSSASPPTAATQANLHHNMANMGARQLIQQPQPSVNSHMRHNSGGNNLIGFSQHAHAAAAMLPLQYAHQQQPVNGMMNPFMAHIPTQFNFAAIPGAASHYDNGTGFHNNINPSFSPNSTPVLQSQAPPSQAPQSQVPQSQAPQNQATASSTDALSRAAEAMNNQVAAETANKGASRDKKAASQTPANSQEGNPAQPEKRKRTYVRKPKAEGTADPTAPEEPPKKRQRMTKNKTEITTPVGPEATATVAPMTNMSTATSTPTFSPATLPNTNLHGASPAATTMMSALATASPDPTLVQTIGTSTPVAQQALMAIETLQPTHSFGQTPGPAILPPSAPHRQVAQLSSQALNFNAPPSPIPVPSEFAAAVISAPVPVLNPVPPTHVVKQTPAKGIQKQASAMPNKVTPVPLPNIPTVAKVPSVFPRQAPGVAPSSTAAPASAQASAKGPASNQAPAPTPAPTPIPTPARVSPQHRAQPFKTSPVGVSAQRAPNLAFTPSPSPAPGQSPPQSSSQGQTQPVARLPVQHSTHVTAQPVGQQPIQHAVQQQAQNTAQQPTHQAAQRPAQNVAQKPGQQFAQQPAQNAVQHAVQNAQNPAQHPVQHNAQNQAQSPVQNQVQAAGQHQAQAVSQQQAQVAALNGTQPAIQHPFQHAVRQPVQQQQAHPQAQQQTQYPFQPPTQQQVGDAAQQVQHAAEQQAQQLVDQKAQKQARQRAQRQAQTKARKQAQQQQAQQQAPNSVQKQQQAQQQAQILIQQHRAQQQQAQQHAHSPIQQTSHQVLQDPTNNVVQHQAPTAAQKQVQQQAQQQFLQQAQNALQQQTEARAQQQHAQQKAQQHQAQQHQTQEQQVQQRQAQQQAQSPIQQQGQQVLQNAVHQQVPNAAQKPMQQQAQQHFLQQARNALRQQSETKAQYQAQQQAQTPTPQPLPTFPFLPPPIPNVDASKLSKPATLTIISPQADCELYCVFGLHTLHKFRVRRNTFKHLHLPPTLTASPFPNLAYINFNEVLNTPGSNPDNLSNLPGETADSHMQAFGRLLKLLDDPAKQGQTACDVETIWRLSNLQPALGLDKLYLSWLRRCMSLFIKQVTISVLETNGVDTESDMMMNMNPHGRSVVEDLFEERDLKGQDLKKNKWEKALEACKNFTWIVEWRTLASRLAYLSAVDKDAGGKFVLKKPGGGGMLNRSLVGEETIDAIVNTRTQACRYLFNVVETTVKGWQRRINNGQRNGGCRNKLCQDKRTGCLVQVVKGLGLHIPKESTKKTTTTAGPNNASPPIEPTFHGPSNKLTNGLALHSVFDVMKAIQHERRGRYRFSDVMLQQFGGKCNDCMVGSAFGPGELNPTNPLFPMIDLMYEMLWEIRQKMFEWTEYPWTEKIVLNLGLEVDEGARGRLGVIVGKTVDAPGAGSDGGTGGKDDAEGNGGIVDADVTMGNAGSTSG